MEAMNEAIRQQLATLLATLDPYTNSSNFKALIHDTILDQCGLLQKREEFDQDGEGGDEESFFQEEVRLQKMDMQDESLRLYTERAAYKERLKNIAVVIGASGGWFPDEEE